jgi:hypothetical protein
MQYAIWLLKKEIDKKLKKIIYIKIMKKLIFGILKCRIIKL